LVRRLAERGFTAGQRGEFADLDDTAAGAGFRRGLVAAREENADGQQGGYGA
jgi:hypothetical protein